MWFFFVASALSLPMNKQQVLDRKNYILPPETLPLYEELTLLAEQKNLAEQSTWLRLIHYEQKGKNKYISDQDGDYFFRSEEGKRNPTAELHATIKDLLMPVEQFENQNHHPQCMFAGGRNRGRHWH